MNIADVERLFEEWTPRWTAWDRDNVGLQVGDRSRRVRRILVALDVTDEVITEAITKRIDLIVSHHPLLFRPASSVTTSDRVGRHVLSLAEHQVALFSAHTNLDFARDGVSFALAEVLGLVDVRFLSPLKETLVKLAVFVPEEHVEKVADAMAQAGAGIVGNYTECSFRIKGTGTFRGSDEAKPFVGKTQQLERVAEMRLEMILPRAKVAAVTAAMKAVHPYEEVAYDVYPLANPNPNFGMGAIGKLPKRLSLRSFLSRIKKALNAEALRYAGDLRQSVRTVAVCGGSGSDLLDEAMAADADVFVTADIRYHRFHDAHGRIALVDAGHWETEHVVLPSVERRLREAIRSSGEAIRVFVSQHSTNPTHCL